MATLNGREVNLGGLTSEEIGDMIVKASPAGNCQDITLALTEEEEKALKKAFEREMAEKGVRTLDRFFEEIILDAIGRKTGSRPTGINYRYCDREFRTLKT